MADAIHSLSDEALVHRILSDERDLVRARFSHSMNQLQNTAQLRDLRRGLARLQTEARARETKTSLPKGSLVDRHRKSFSPTGEANVAPPAADRGGFLKGIVDKLTTKE